MKITTSLELGKTSYQFEFEGEDEREIMHKAFILSNPPKHCTICDSKNVRFYSNKDKEANTYVYVACECGAQAKLGILKAGGYFWKEFEKWQGYREEVKPRKQVRRADPEALEELDKELAALPDQGPLPWEADAH